MLKLRFPPTLRDRRQWPWLVLSLLAFIAGVWLRWYQLRTQTLIDDEWHAVRMLISSDAARIATHFGYADYCIPLTLYYRWLYDLGALSEWQMHLPIFLAGIALLVVAPFVMRGSVELPVLAVWLALLAVSPVLVYLSRMARPYALDCLCAFVAIVSFYRWRYEARSRRRSAIMYVFATVAAAWLHLLTIVFTLWPFVWFGVPLLRGALRPSTRNVAMRDIVRTATLAVAVVAGLALALVPPLIGDWRAMAAKAGSDTVTGDSLFRSLLMMFGTGSTLAGIVLAIVLAIGIWRLWERESRFTGYIVSMIVVGAATIAISRPAWIQHEQTFVRYALPALPFLLLFLAEGIVFLVAPLRMQIAVAGAAALVVAALVVIGPLPHYYYYPNQVMNHELFQFDYSAAANPYSTLLELGPVPAFYRDLSTRPPGSITLIETPARLLSNYLPETWYQPIHHQNVKYALASPVCGNGDTDEIPYTATGTNFRNLGKLDDILHGATWGADYLVLRMRPWSVPPGLAIPWPDMDACAAKVAARIGPAVYGDDQITVFALARNRKH